MSEFQYGSVSLTLGSIQTRGTSTDSGTVATIGTVGVGSKPTLFSEHKGTETQGVNEVGADLRVCPSGSGTVTTTGSGELPSVRPESTMHIRLPKFLRLRKSQLHKQDKPMEIEQNADKEIVDRCTIPPGYIARIKMVNLPLNENILKTKGNVSISPELKLYYWFKVIFLPKESNFTPSIPMKESGGKGEKGEKKLVFSDKLWARIYEEFWMDIQKFNEISSYKKFFGEVKMETLPESVKLAK